MEQNKRPNILWICTDQQRTETLGCYGNPFVRTPNIDSLATHGIRFTNAYAQSPVCMPSRASFLTGRYPNTCGVRYNGQDMRASEAEYLIPRRLRDDAGYTCGLCGKLHLGIGNPAVTPVMEHRINDGYDYFAWSHEPGYRWPTNGYSLWLSACGNPTKLRRARTANMSAKVCQPNTTTRSGAPTAPSSSWRAQAILTARGYFLSTAMTRTTLSIPPRNTLSAIFPSWINCQCPTTPSGN